MGQIQEVVEKLRKGSHTKSIREELRKPEKSMIFSEESSRIIHELGQHGAVRLRTNVQHHPIPFLLQTCAGRTEILKMRNLLPTRRRYNQKNSSTTSNLHYLARVDRSRGKKCDALWQKDHWKAVDASRATNKHGKDTITIRWQEDEQ